MRTFGACLVLVLFVAMLVGTSGNPVGDNAVLTLETADQPLTLSDVNDQQGHENEGDRLVRDYGGHHDGHHEKHHDKHHDGHYEKHHEGHPEKHHEGHYEKHHGGHHG
ncbi:histidine-rich glycoprotein-like [Bactrocera dorsalis]|uniref:Histidine-rich glycoprotein-like n=1 Tax=Bactrocera dorsalis TaxID=27457 RepID=A0ABM3JER7_BACDO|nr:histidine-rich glycoprotein-like [Bactrocera dorsalis]